MPTIAGLAAKLPAATGPVGLAFPAVVKGGKARTAANIDHAWIGADGAALIRRTLDRNALFLNDADAAGLAEMRLGAGRGVRGAVVMLTFGTGIGSALFLDGKLVPNTELGHLEMRGKDAEQRASAKVRDDKDLSWEDWAARVQEYLALVEKLFSPDLVIVGGGVSKHPEKFLHFQSLRAHIVPAEMANDAGIIGAALAARSHHHHA